MKKTILFAALCFIGFSAFAQNFDKRWTEVEQLEVDGKSKSALEKIKSIYDKAERKENDVQFVKAFLYKAKYKLLLKEGAQKEVYAEFRTAIKNHKTPVDQILASVLAESLHKYYKNNRYKIRRRTETDSTKKDFKTWTREDFEVEIRALQKLSFSGEKKLIALPQKKFKDVLSYGENYGKFRSSLYDLLVNRVLEMLSDQYFYEDHSEMAFTNPDYFSLPEKFIELDLPSPKEETAKLNPLKLYQKLTKLHSQDSNSQLFVSLDRLDFVRDNWKGKTEKGDSLYSESLFELKTIFISNLQHRWIAYKLALFYHKNADKSKHPQYELKALQQIKNILVHSKKQNRLQVLATNLKKRILAEETQVEAEKLALSGKPSKALINFRNLDSVYLSFYRLDDDDISARGYFHKDNIKKLIQQNEPFETKEIKLPEVNNHLNYSTEVLLPAFGYGHYLVVASPQKNLDLKEEVFSTSTFQVSRLAITEHKSRGRTRFVVTDRISGKPIEGAEITLKENDQILSTDKNGIADLTNFKGKHKRRYNQPAEITYKKDHFKYKFDFRKKEKAEPKDQDKKPLYVNAELMSDRSIYRPGQPFYFKGIIGAFSKDGSFRKTVKGLPVTLKLYNANDILVDSLKLKTNDYGSVNGKFDLPKNGLTGGFELRMLGKPTKQEAKKFIKNNPWTERIENLEFEPRLNFRVEEYKRPKFEVTFDKIDSTYIIGDSVSLTGKAEAFFGGKIANQPVRFVVERSIPYQFRSNHYLQKDAVRIFSDTIKTDADGNFDIQFKAIADSATTKKQKPIFSFTAEATVTDINGETHSVEKSIRIGFHATELTLSMPDQVKIGKGQIIKLLAKDLNNLKSNAKGTLKLYRFETPQRLLKRRDLGFPDFQQIPKDQFLALFPHQAYKKSEITQPEKTLVKTFQIDTEQKDSIAIAEFGNIRSAANYLLEFKGKGERRFELKTEKRFEIFNSKKPFKQLSDFVEMHSELQQEKRRIKLTLETQDSVYVYYEIADNIKLLNEKGFWLRPGSTEKFISIPPNTKELYAQVSYFKDGYNGKVEKEIAVPKKKKAPQRELQMEVTHFEDKMKPGSEQSWELKVHNKKGKPLEVEVLASMYDASLDQFQPHSWSPNLFEPKRRYSYRNELPDLDFHTGGPGYRQSSTFNNRNFFGTYTANLTYTGLEFFGYDFLYVENGQKRYLESLTYKYSDKKGFTGFIRGRVENQDGLPLPGVNIRIKGTSKGTHSDFDGNYSLKVAKNDKLFFRYIGFSDKKIAINNRNLINITLEESNSDLDNVVVSGYRSTEGKYTDFNYYRGKVYDKNKYSNATTTLDEVMLSPENSIVKKLEAEVAGLKIGTNDGRPGSNSTVILRGTGSANETSKPLFIVDGVPLSENEFRELSEGDIISVEVLKNAKATALYGNRGANGVVIINTKNAGKKLDQIEPRKNLKETAFFLPNLKTDKNGNIRFQFKGPEALTRWKFQAFAHDKQLYQDYVSLQSITQKDLNIIPNFPRFFRSGDEVVISAKINNMAKNQVNGIAKLKFTNAYSEKEIDLVQDVEVVKNFSISAKGNASVSWKVAIPENLSAVRYTISAKAENFTDAQTDVLPVLSNRLFITETFPFWVNPNQETSFEFSALKNNTSKTLDNHSLQLEYTANPVWTALESLPYLIDFPHECAEQTFARLNANSLAFNLVDQKPEIEKVLKSWKNSEEIETPLEQNEELKSVALEETPWVQTAQNQEQQQRQLAENLDPEKAKRQTASVLTKLSAMQLESGGFPWFAGGRESQNISLHIYTGFARMKNLGISLEGNSNYEKIIKGLNRYLSNHLENQAYDLDELEVEKLNAKMLQYFYAKYLISEIEVKAKLAKIRQALLKKFKPKWLSLSLRNKILLALVADQNRDLGFAKKILNALKEQSVINSDNGMYWKENTSGRHWNEAPIATQTLAIEAYAEIENENKTVDKLKEWLLRQKQLQAWKSTKATTNAVYALLLNGNDWKSNGKTKQTFLKVGGEPISFDGAAGKTGYIKKKFDVDEINSKKADIQVKNKTKSPQYGAMYWQYFEDADKVTASNSKDLSIEKKWFIKTESSSGSKLKPLDTRQPKIGDLLTVRLVIKANEDFEFMHLKDLRPAGLEPVDVLSKYRYQDGLGYYQSTKDIATHFFFGNLPKGTYVFEYDLRVNNRGDFTGGITTLQSMYAPEFSVRSEGKRLEVKK